MGKRQRRRLREHGQPVMPHWTDPDPKRDAEDEATTRLRRLVDQRKVIDREIDAEIDRLEVWGFTWAVIGRALGVTPQAARQRSARRRGSPHRARAEPPRPPL
jgi:hypothetical protein